MSNETRSGSTTSIARVAQRLFFFLCEGIVIENHNKFPGVVFFGYFLFDKKKKVTCCRSTTDEHINSKKYTIYIKGNTKPKHQAKA